MCWFYVGGGVCVWAVLWKGKKEKQNQMTISGPVIYRDAQNFTTIIISKKIFFFFNPSQTTTPLNHGDVAAIVSYNFKV